MEQVDRVFGELNSKAPTEPARFAFLIGAWRCEANLKSDNGDWKTYEGAWRGRCILDGYAIADEYRMVDRAGALIVLGMNFRVYDAKTQSWNIKWLDGLSGTWTDLGADEFGGVAFDGQSVIYAFSEPMAAHAFTRAIYTNISENHFRWRGEKSDDGKSWTEFMVVECHRSDA